MSDLSRTNAVTYRFLAHHDCVLTMAWLEMSLIVAETWSVLHHAH